MTTRLNRLVEAALNYQVMRANARITEMECDKSAEEVALGFLKDAAAGLPKYLLDQHPAIKRRLVATSEE